MLILWACLLNVPAADLSLADEVNDESVRRCIPYGKLTSVAVIDDRNVLFFMIGKPIYHNILLQNCIGLAQSGRFSYSPFAGAVCAFDQIRLVGSLLGRSCQLGYFYRVTKEDLPAIIEGPQGPLKPRPLPSAKVEEISTESDEPREPTQN